MARPGFTERLAVASARRPRLTILVWVALLAASATLYFLWGDVFTSSFKFLSKPDSRVAADLIEEHGGGNGVAQLGTAVEQLADGLVKADAGAGKLAKGSGKVADGATSLSRGLDKLAGGADEVSAGAGQTSSGAGELSTGLSDTSRGASELSSGLDAMNTATGGLSAALLKLARGGSQLASGSAKLASGAKDLAGGASSAAAGVKEAAAAADQLEAGATSLSALVNAYLAANPEAANDPTYQQIVSAAGQVAAGSSALASGLHSATAGTAAVAAGASDVAGGAADLSSGASKLAVGLEKSAGGAQQIDRGMGGLASGGDELAGGIGAATSGSRQLAAGSSELAAGSSRVASGVEDAATGAGKVAKGTRAVEVGATGLSNGLSSVSSGAQQLTEALASASSLTNHDTEVVVIHSDDLTVEDPAFEALVTDVRDAIAALPEEDIASVTSAYDEGLDERARDALTSDDGHTTILRVELATSSSEAANHMDDLYGAVTEANGELGFAVAVTGPGAFSRDSQNLATEDLKRGEAIGVPVAMVILIFVFGALVAAGLPLVLSVFTIAVGLGLTVLIGMGFELSIFAINVLAAFGLAVGIDYSLFIVSRYREERHAGREKAEAIAAAAGTASNAVLFSGLTVVLALGGMLIVPLSIITSIGLGAICAVLAAVSAALTLLPALLMLVGDRIDALAVPWIPHHSVRMSSEGWWGRAARRTMRRPVLGLAVSVALLVLLAVPMFSMRTGGFSAATFPESYTSKQGLDILQRDFAAGMSEPITVVIDGDIADATVRDGLERFIAALDADGRFTLTGVQTSADRSLAVVQLVQDAESMSEEARSGVLDLRTSLAPQAFRGTPATIHVGGQTATSIDASHVIDGYLWLVVGVVLLLSFVLLLVAFRSVLVAFTAVLMNLLSVAAAFGVLTLVFQEGVGADLLRMTQVSAIESWVPLLMFCVLFGLSMDYQVFLLSRIRERWQATRDSNDAVIFGVQSTAGIITGAALIMIAVFVGLGSGELVILQQLGLGLAVAVLLDAFIVRVLVAPATIALLGDRYWWLPRWLEWLPRVNIEGRAGDPVVSPARASDGSAADAG